MGTWARVMENQDDVIRQAMQGDNATSSAESAAILDKRVPVELKAHRLSVQAVLHMQSTRGNAAVQRMLANYRRIQREAEDDQEDNQASPEASQSADSEPAVAQDNVESDEASTYTSSDESESAQDTDTDQPTDSSDSDSGTTAAGDSDSGDGNDSDDTTEGTGREVTTQGQTHEPVTYYGGHGGIYDAEGYCSWHDISSDVKYTVFDLPGGKVQAKGQATLTFVSQADYTLPDVPSTITNECEKKKYKQAIDTTLRAHEEKHKAAFLTYNGSTTSSINITGSSDADVETKANAQVLDPVDNPRYAAAKKKSADVDPAGGYKFTPDLSGCN